jgi:hypothetical protein
MQLLLSGMPIAEVQATIIEDGAVVINVERQFRYRLNRWAAFIWLRMCECMPILEIAREVAGNRGDLPTTISLVKSLHEKFLQAAVLLGKEPEPSRAP